MNYALAGDFCATKIIIVELKFTFRQLSSASIPFSLLPFGVCVGGGGGGGGGG